MSNTKEELHATITARAELDRAFARLLVEDAAVVMSRNMLTILDQRERDIDAERQAIQTIVKEAIASALTPVMAEFRAADADREELRTQIDTVIARIDANEERLDRKRERLDQHDIELAEIRARLDARPSPEKAQATYEGVRRILDHLGLNDDGAQ